MSGIGHVSNDVLHRRLPRYDTVFMAVQLECGGGTLTPKLYAGGSGCTGNEIDVSALGDSTDDDEEDMSAITSGCTDGMTFAN